MKNEFLKQIIQCPLDKSQYYQEKYEKKQIVLHHTASNGNAKNVITGWKETVQKIGVAFVIDGEGGNLSSIQQCPLGTSFRCLREK